MPLQKKKKISQKVDGPLISLRVKLLLLFKFFWILTVVPPPPPKLHFWKNLDKYKVILNNSTLQLNTPVYWKILRMLFQTIQLWNKPPKSIKALWYNVHQNMLHSHLCPTFLKWGRVNFFTNIKTIFTQLPLTNSI